MASFLVQTKTKLMFTPVSSFDHLVPFFLVMCDLQRCGKTLIRVSRGVVKEKKAFETPSLLVAFTAAAIVLIW